MVLIPIDSACLDGVLVDNLTALVLGDLRDRVGLIGANVPQVHRLLLLADHLIVAVGHEPEDPQPVVPQFVRPLHLRQMFSDLTKRVLLSHLVRDAVIEGVEELLELEVDLVVEVGGVKAAEGGGVRVLNEPHLLPDLVDLVDDALEVGCPVLLDLHLLLATLRVGINLFELLGPHLLVLLGLTRLVLAQIVLFHLLQELGVLRLGNLFVADAHAGVVGGDATHGHVREVEEGHFALVDLQLLFLQEVEVEELAVLLLVVALQVLVFLPHPHLPLLSDGVLEDAPRRGANVSEVVDGERVVAPHDRVVDILDLGQVRLCLDVVAELPELLVELPDSLDLLQAPQPLQLRHLRLDRQVAHHVPVLLVPVPCVRIEVASDLVEVVLAPLRQLQVGVLRLLVLPVHDLLAAARTVLPEILVLEARRWGRLLEVEPVAVVLALDLLVEALRPLPEMLDVSGDVLAVRAKLARALLLDVGLVAGDDAVVEVVVLVGQVLKEPLLLVSDELVVLLLCVLLLVRMQVLHLRQLLQHINLPELVHVLEPGLVTHPIQTEVNIIIMLTQDKLPIDHFSGINLSSSQISLLKLVCTSCSTTCFLLLRQYIWQPTIARISIRKKAAAKVAFLLSLCLLWSSCCSESSPFL